MDLTAIMGAGAAASWLVWVRLTAAQRLFLPAMLLYGSSLGHALQGASEGFVLLGSAMRGAGLALMVVELLKAPFASRSSSAHHKILTRPLLIGTLGLLLVITAHNLIAGRGALPVSPWGLAFLMISVLYWLYTADAINKVTEGDVRFAVLMAWILILLAMLVLAVRVGILPGNTAKFQLAEGGVGLANLSTNETAALALAPLLWVLRLVEAKGSGAARLGYVSIFASLTVVLSSGSRIAIGIAGVILVGFLFRGGDAAFRGRKFTVAAILAVLLLLGTFVIRARTRSEVDAFAGGSAATTQYAVPGAERVIVWSSYITSFFDVAHDNPQFLIRGVGPAGIADVYATSALPILGVTIERASFYPVHSDLIELLMTTGVVGVLFLMLMARGLYAIPLSRGEHAHAFFAAFTFMALFSVDMLQYVPGVTSIVFASYVATIDVHHGDRLNES